MENVLEMKSIYLHLIQTFNGQIGDANNIVETDEN